jgi:hypothetical protein
MSISLKFELISIKFLNLGQRLFQMKLFKIKVTEYGVKSKSKKITPPDYTWDYCIKKKIPYIIVKPRIKYSNIDYDMLTIDDGLDFTDGNSFVEHWCKVYEDYLVNSSFPQNMIPVRIIGEVTDNFTVFKKDEDIMVRLLMKEIEEYVNKYGIINSERKEYSRMAKDNSLNQ